MNKLISAFFLLLSPLFSQAQALQMEPTGTGLTTGHIADLRVTNTSRTTIIINPQTVYIPSEGKFQPYVANIPGTPIPPGTSYVRVEGYCADVHALPVPTGNAMPAITNWIPVVDPGININPGAVNLITTPAMPMFKASDVVTLTKTPGYTPFSIKGSTTIYTTWPGTTLPFEGTINPKQHPKPFSPVLVEALHSIIRAYDQLKQSGGISTPYSSNPEKERQTVIQQTFWIYTAWITGEYYQKQDFREKVFRQFEDKNSTSRDNVPTADINNLDRGIDAFWNTFTNLRIEAKLLTANKVAAGARSTAATILPPWDKIDLLDPRMKPQNKYVVATPKKFPLVPAIGGAVGVGTLIFFATLDGDDDDPIDTTGCTFIATSTSTGSNCGLSDGSIQLNVTPSGNYSFQWSNGATTQNLNNIPAGNYSVTVTLIGTNCTKIASASVANINTNFTATIAAQPTDCDNQNGSVTITTAPPGVYTFQWSNGATTQSLSNLAAGNYSVTVSAGGSCEEVLSATVGVKSFDPSVSFNTTPSSCGGSDGSATISVTPPDTYNYAWSNGQNGTTASGLNAGNYTVTITKPGTSCTHVANVTVNDITPAFTISISSTMSGCGLSNGSASVVVNPPGAYDFVWSNGQTGAQINGLAGGTYTVTVSIAGSTCSKEASVTITEAAAAFSVSVTGTQARCGLTDGTASVTVDPPGSYSYSWSNGQTGSQITGLAPGNYTVTVSIPGTNCSKQGSVNITAEDFPNEITLSTTPASCGGADGTVTATSNPPAALTFLWSNGQTTSQISGVGAGTYTVTVTLTGTNCSKILSATVESLPTSFTASVTTTPAGCGMNNGSASVTVNPPGSYDYAWSNGQTGSAISNIVAGSYTVTVTITGTTCTQVASGVVEQLPASFLLSFNSTPADCGMTNGSASVMVDPPGAYTYLWSNGATGAQLNNVGAGSYLVTVTLTGTSCTTTGSVMVGQTGGGSGLTATFTTDNTSCGLMNGTATVTVSPPGSYTFLWSNGQIGPTASQLGAGTYTVTVTENGGCAQSFSVDIGADPAEYVTILSTNPATCIGGGNIRFTVISGGAGPMIIEVQGPMGMTTITVPSGSVVDLSTHITVLPGMYTLTVYDQTIGVQCNETVSATLADVTPPLLLDSDFYTTEGTDPVQENALINDSGLNIQMTQIDNEIGGSVTFLPNGNFTFIADPGFSGEASFLYTVTDACGRTAVTEVTIIVAAVPCPITVTFNATPASCGLADGSVTANVNPPGDYSYQWSNGANGPTLNNVPPAPYTVTITDLEEGCTFEASYILQGLPGDYIEDVEIIQPSCEAGGDIEFMAISPGGNNLRMMVQYPFGTEVVNNIEEGLVRLSDYITTAPGNYTVELSDPQAGPGCSESFNATLIAPPLPQIVVVEVIPPSFPGANDAQAFIEVVVPGQFSYAVYVNGLFAFIVNQNNFFLINLSPGAYSVYLVDINACQSNTEQFVVPNSSPNFAFGMSITDAGSVSANAEQPSIQHNGKIWRSALTGTYRFDIGNIPQEMRVLYAPSFRLTSGELLHEYIATEYLTGPNTMKWNDVDIFAQAGIGARVGAQDPLYWMLRASAERTFLKRLMVSGNVSLMGMDKIGLNWEWGLRWKVR